MRNLLIPLTGRATDLKRRRWLVMWSKSAEALNRQVLAGCAVLAAGSAVAANHIAPNLQRVQGSAKQSSIEGPIFHVQVLLDRANFSPGVIDGKVGMSFRAAVKGFQASRDLPTTGESFRWRGLRFEVVDMDARRIDKLLVHRQAPG